jgi:hypothetical protein
MAHAIVEPRYLTRTAVINRVELVEPPARVVHCAICASAEEAQTRPAGRSSVISNRHPMRALDNYARILLEAEPDQV